MVSVDVAGVAQAHAPGGGGYFDEPTTGTVDDVDLASLIPEGKEYVTARVQVSALGINADRHADDDVSRSVSFTVARDPGAVPAPEPEPDPGEGSGVVPVDPVPPGIMSVPRTSAQMPQNYAVNLAADADEATFQRALYQASLLGGMVLESYPALRTFFVQSSSAAFAMDLGYALADSGISFHSVGPTRQAPVVGNEAIVSQELGAPAYPSVEEKPPVPEGSSSPVCPPSAFPVASSPAAETVRPSCLPCSPEGTEPFGEAVSAPPSGACRWGGRGANSGRARAPPTRRGAWPARHSSAHS